MPEATTTAPLDAAPAEVAALLRDGRAVLVDVREPDEHARERIAGAHLVPLSAFNPEKAATHATAGQAIVMQCRSGRRSADAVRLCAPLAARGVRIINLTGGIEAWKAAGLPVESSSAAPRMSVMRQTQLAIGLGVLTGCALAWLVHPGFLGLAAFFGAGLVVAGLTGTCGLATVIGLLPWNRGACSMPPTGRA